MSYIADQLKRIGLLIDYKNKTPINEYSPYTKVKIQFSHVNGKTNYMDITDSELKQIYRILIKGDNLHSNRRRGLRRNPMNRIEKLRKILSDMQYAKIDGQIVDATTARAILLVYDGLNEQNKARYSSMPIIKMANIAWKMVK